jgi:predicted O-methyltransferase YrrM
LRQLLSWRQSLDPLPAIALSPHLSPDLPTVLRSYEPYRPIFRVSPDTNARLIASWPVKDGLIATRPRGFLRPADALSLYDIARYGTGRVLEIGSAWGLSTTILCRAVKARRTGKLVSFEIAPDFQRLTRLAIRELGLSPWHEMRGGEASQLMEQAVRREESFSAIFIDHDHGSEASHAACRLLPRLLAPKGFMLFHDFNDPLNQTGEYGVYDAVRAMLTAHPGLAFYGMPGCCALIGWR